MGARHSHVKHALIQMPVSARANSCFYKVKVYQLCKYQINAIDSLSGQTFCLQTLEYSFLPLAI